MGRSSSAPSLELTMLLDVGQRCGVHAAARYHFLRLKNARDLSLCSLFTGSLDNMNYAFFNVFILNC